MDTKPAASLLVFLSALITIASCDNCVVGERKLNLRKGIDKLNKLVNKYLCDDADINVDLCTHATLLHFFRFVGNDSDLQIQENRFENFQPLVKVFKSKCKPVILAVGLDPDGLSAARFSAIASKEESRNVFVNLVIQVIENFNLDGLLLNWQYPVFWENNLIGKRSPYDGVNYVQLAENLSKKLKAKNKILQGFSTNDAAFYMYFDFKKLDRFIDYWLLPAYHFEGPWSVMTAISSSYLRADLMLLNHLKILPPEKILLGIPTHYLPVVVDSTVKKIRLSSRLKASFTPNQQLSTFRQLCEQAAKGGLTVVHNESSTVNSYAFLKNDFVSFESSISAVNKVAHTC
ncbi:Hypothetical predicted protein [Cloeon dipterum]|uniref:GH18 domain-containing protein n=1 Tax=Cloeon dipterum TaxID=197152 RepID=A0A8S1BX33_9INSE|nr:Hypothetical predicted protein [Cloeon dipterum]